MKTQTSLRQNIIDIVCNEYRVTFADLKVRTRKQMFVVPRQIIFYFWLEYKLYNLKGAGDIFTVDHATVIHSCRKIKEFIETNKNFAISIQNLKRQIENSYIRIANLEVDFYILGRDKGSINLQPINNQQNQINQNDTI